MDIEERLAQNKKDIEALEVEKRKLEAELEKQKEPQHGDFGYFYGSKADPIVYLRTDDTKIRAYNHLFQLSEPLSQWKVEIVGNIFKGDRI